jgi:hypothetical protein
MSDEPINVRQVRWMGVGVGVVVAAIGLFFCFGGWTIGTEAVEKGGMGLWLGTAGTLLVGVLVVRYGVSMVRRARNDDDVATLTGANGGLGYRGVWWSRRRPPQ